MKRLLFIIAITLSLATVYAQHDPQFSLNMFNNAAINPGAAGLEDGVSASALIHEQWLGFPGRPSTRVFNVNSNVPWDVQAFGAGLTIMQDNFGFSKNILLDLAIAPRFNVGDGTIGVGLGIGFNNQALSNAEWLTADPNFNPSQDPLIPQDESTMVLDLSFGAHYQADHLWISLSARHLNSPVVEFSQTAATYLRTTYYGSAGYAITLPNPLFEITPSVFAKSDGVVMQVDFNAILEYDKRIWGGVTYRLEDAYVAMVGMRLLSGFSFGMAWDFPTTDIGTYASGSIEFFGRYVFPLGLKTGTTRKSTILGR
jgi:type IX secretion system PorP/SprF family membrane protein